LTNGDQHFFIGENNIAVLNIEAFVLDSKINF